MIDAGHKMHISAFNFVASCAEKFRSHFTFKDVLEVGSLDLNGSIKPLFVGCTYTGIDLVEGPNVDLVGHLLQHKFPLESFDVVVSLEAMEHDEAWDKSLREMFALLKPKGLLIITCATTGREEHGTHKSDPSASPATLDHYRNLTAWDFFSEIDVDSFSYADFHFDSTVGDLHFMGIKK